MGDTKFQLLLLSRACLVRLEPCHISVSFCNFVCLFVCFLFSFSSRGSDANINLSLTETRLPALEQCVEDACPLDERVLRIREEREQFGRGIERKEREIREQRSEERL